MILLTVGSSIIFIVSWLASRRGRPDAQVSDIFVLGFIIIFLPFFVLNTSAETRFNTPPFQPTVVLRAVYGILTFMAVGTLLFFVRAIAQTLRPSSRIEVSNKALSVCGLAALIILAALLSAFVSDASFREFRADTYRWIAGGVDGQEYAVLRKLHSTPFLDGIVGRLRYSVLPILLLVLVAKISRQGSVIRVAIIGMAFFAVFPMSFSKMPFVYYAGYVLLFVTVIRTNFLTIRSAAAISIFGAVGSAMMIAVLYLAQYRGAGGYQNIFDEPVRLAADRMWGESYSVILRYFATYPDLLSHSGWAGLNLPAKLLGLGFRNPDIEVTTTILGPNSGSNPGIFFLSGYASFGYLGVAIYSAIGFGIIWIFDIVAQHLRTRICYQIYIAIMSLNVLFLLQIALQTTLFSYGLAVIPAVLVALDRVLIRYPEPIRKRQAKPLDEKHYI